MTRPLLKRKPFVNEEKGNKRMRNTNRKFLILEYKSLRREILDLKKRVIQIFTIGLTSIPVLLGVGYNADYYILLILSPIVSVSWCLVLLFEQNSIMRAGAYISIRIEGDLLNKQRHKQNLGWENWLESTKEARQAEGIFKYSVVAIFVVYYVVCSFLAYFSAKKFDQTSHCFSILIILFYAVFFIVVFMFVVKNFKIHSTLREKRI